MRKKDIWDYDKTRKASGHTFGSRLVHILLIGGCISAVSTIFLSLFFYFFPAQALRSAQMMKDFAKQAIEALQSSKEPSLQGTSTSRNLQQSSRQPSVAAIQTDTVAVAMELIDSSSPNTLTAKLETYTNASQVSSDIPLITFSSSQGDTNTIGREDTFSSLDEDYLVMVGSAMGPMLYYNQGDSRWADYLYGGTDAMSQYGCGPTVAAMLINAFTPHTVIPPNIADWAAANGCHAPHNGSYHSVIPKTLSAYGLQVESVSEINYETAAGLLRSDHVLVALVGRGTFSNDGHFIIITNILENGNVRIADSYNFENTKQEWDLNQLLSELKHSGDDGGPLWAVSYPN